MDRRHRHIKDFILLIFIPVNIRTSNRKTYDFSTKVLQFYQSKASEKCTEIKGSKKFKISICLVSMDSKFFLVARKYV